MALRPLLPRLLVSAVLLPVAAAAEVALLLRLPALWLEPTFEAAFVVEAGVKAVITRPANEEL
jgi:hypothetical protein